MVDKPAGLVVHPGAGNPTARSSTGCWPGIPEIAGVGEPHRPGIVHRLDVGTSGLLVVARTARAYHSLVDALAAARRRRACTARWCGVIPQPARRDRRADRPRSPRPDADGRRGRRQAGPHPLPGAAATYRDAGRRQRAGMPAGDRAHPPDPGPPGGDRPSGGRRRHVRRRPPRHRAAAAVPARRRAGASTTRSPASRCRSTRRCPTTWRQSRRNSTKRSERRASQASGSGHGADAAGGIGDRLQREALEEVAHVLAGRLPDGEQHALALVVARAVLVGLAEVAEA